MVVSRIGYQKFMKAYWLLRTTFGLLFLLVGIDKFFNFLVNWQQFLCPLTVDYVSISPFILIRLFGLYQIILGLFLFSRWTLLSAYAALLTLIFIFFNLIGTSDLYIVMGHDVIMIMLAITLIFLTNIEHGIQGDGKTSILFHDFLKKFKLS